jgi:hypothetical protein
MNLNIKFDLYCWACDFSSNRGEGILARHYIISLSKIKKKKIFVKTPYADYYINNGILKKHKTESSNQHKLNFNFFENYFYPLIGILYLWINCLKRRGICYLNFLPLWNIFLFLFLPPKTHLGPITGFIFEREITGLSFFLRKYLNNFLFRVSLSFLFLRQNKIYFSTDLLKSLINKKYKNKVFFNYLVNLINIKKKIIKKNIDFLIYNRNYSVKNNILREKLLEILSRISLKIIVIGDHLSFKGVKNLGFVSREKANSLLKRTKFIINSGENPYNIFTIDAFNNHSNIIYEKKFFDKVHFFDKNKIFFFHFNDENVIKKILRTKTSHTIKTSTLTKNYKNIKNDYFNYFNLVKIYY